jgi:hypothetical protein
MNQQIQQLGGFFDLKSSREDWQACGFAEALQLEHPGVAHRIGQNHLIAI